MSDAATRRVSNLSKRSAKLVKKHAPTETAVKEESHRVAKDRVCEPRVGTLVEIDGRFPKYSGDCFKRLGSGVARGVRTYIHLQHGIGRPQQIRLAFEVKSGDKHYHVATARVDLEQVLDFREKIIERNDPGALETMRQLLPQELPASCLQYDKIPGFELPPGRRPNGYEDVWLESEPTFQRTVDQLSLPETVMLHGKNIMSMKMRVPSKAFAYFPNKNFNGSYPHNNIVKGLFKETMEMMKDTNALDCFEIHICSMLSESSMGNENNMISPCTLVSGPFASFFTEACKDRKGKDSDLKWSNLTIDDSIRPPKNMPPSPPDTDFTSDEHRTAVLITSAAEEAHYDEWRSTHCKIHSFECTLLPLAGTEWKAELNTDFGVQPNGQPRACILIVGMDEYQYCLPNFGSKVDVQINTTSWLHSYPQGELTGEEVMQAANDVKGVLERAEAEAVKQEVKYVNRRKGGEDHYEDAESAYQEALKEALGRLLSSFMNPFADSPFDMTSEQVQRRLHHRSIEVGLGLMMQDTEEVDAYRARIADWVRENMMAIRNAQGGGSEALGTWTGWRLKLPNGITSNKAIFEVKLPLQTLWPPHFVAPPVQVDMPPLPKGAFRTSQDVLRSLESSSLPLRCRISWRPDSSCAALECDAISRFNASNESGKTNSDWAYWKSFNPDERPERVDMLSRFPELNRRLRAGKYEGLQKNAVTQLSHNRGTFTFIAGSPGSGKSTLSRAIASGVMNPAETDNDMPGPKAPSARDSGLVLWASPTHKLVDEAHKLLRAENPTKNVVRLCSMASEIDNLLRPSSKVPDEVHLPRTIESLENAGLGDFTASRNKQTFEIYSRTAAYHVDSVSAHIRRDMESHTSLHPVLRESQRVFDSNPESWEEKKVKYIEAARKAIVSFLLHRADAITGTPNALSKAASHFPPNSTRPGLIVIDECTRLSEGESLLVSSYLVGTWTLQVGDPAHVGAACESLRDPDYPTIFGKQRSMSLLKRAIICGATVIDLNNNNQPKTDSLRRRRR